MSKVNPEPNIIHIMGCYVLGNPNGEKVGVCGSPLECLLGPGAQSHAGSSKPASSAGWERAAVLSHGGCEWENHPLDCAFPRGQGRKD